MPAIVLVGVLALIGLLAYGVLSKQSSTDIERALARGDRMPAPALTLPRLEGAGTASLADFRGKVVVLNYWASWCEPCRTESPLLQRWHERISRRGGTVLGVDVHDLTSDAKRFIREFRLAYPMLRDVDGRTQRRFGVVAYPETVVIDRRGRVAAVERGPVDEAFMRRHVAPLLEEPA